MARLATFILTEELRGDGRSAVCRRVQQLYTLDGYLVAEFDPCGVRHVEPGKDDRYEPASFCRDLDLGSEVNVRIK